MPADNIWVNGGEVNTTLNLEICNNFGIGSLCKDKEAADLTFKPRPYPSPNPNHYAVLEKPGINRHVMRGCFNSQPENSNFYSAKAPWEAGYIDGYVQCDDYQGSFCAHPSRKEKCFTKAPGGLADFTHPMNIKGTDFLRNGFVIDKCECSMVEEALKDSDYPGILYDTEENGNHLYTCWANKHYRARRGGFLGTGDYDQSCCEPDNNQKCIQKGYTIGTISEKTKENTYGNASEDDDESGYQDEICDQFEYRGSDWTAYQPGELWDGRDKDFGPFDTVPTKCYHWYNPPLDELPGNKKDKNNCSQYLLKWALSCKWCKDNRPTNDALKNCERGTNNCNSPRKCGGGCTKTLDGLLDNTCEWKLAEDDCKICNSDLWDAIPGGWEALADEDHPKHLMAKFAFYPKVIKAKTTNDASCKQPNAVLAEGKPILTLSNSDEGNYLNKNSTTFMGLGPWTNDYTDITFWNKDTVTEYSSNSPAGLVAGYNTSCGEESWTGNADIITTQHTLESVKYCLEKSTEGLCNSVTDCDWKNDQCVPNSVEYRLNLSNYCLEKGTEEVCNSDFKCNWDNDKCLPNRENMIKIEGSENWSIWSDAAVVGDPNGAIQNLESCTFKEGKTGFNFNPRSHTVCARNHNLTGYGESDKENSYLAKLWLEGKWDMTQYTGITDNIIDEGISDETKKERKIEAVRCCLGLSPKYNSETKIYEDPVDLSKERFKLCRPGFSCPSSDACKDLFQDMFENDNNDINYYQFGEAFPDGYRLEGSSELSDDIMENKSYYAKAYCEMMSGGTADLFGRLPVEKVDPETDEIVGCGHDPRAELNCRKAMYNYCVEPVEVNLQDPDGVGVGVDVTKIGYPLRVFTDTCKDWCSQIKLSDSLPGQKGVCDMALGKTCQQLQVDGWIDPTNWGNSKLLKFVDPDGNWIENPDLESNNPEPESSEELDTTIFGSHKNLTAKRIKNVCGCFLMGAECGNGNCSVSYCGAGTDGSKGPGMVKFGKTSEYKESVREGCSNEFPNNPDGNYVNEVVCNMKTVYDYDGVDSEARAWTSNIDSNEFTCLAGDRSKGCFSGCNYVNYNDTCWLASPEERKQDLVFDVPNPTNQENFGDLKRINTWACEDKSVGDSCKTYDGEYGCFGYCGINDYTLEKPQGNCGTSEWFNHQMNINPSEVRYKQRKELIENNDLDQKPNVSYSWPKWQNFYAEQDQIPKSTPVKDANTTYNISGWGSYKTGTDGKPVSFDGNNSLNDIDKNLCSFGACADPDAVKPFRNYLAPKTCPSSCSVSMTTVVNNQGAIIGGINSSLNGQFACQTNANWSLNSLSNNNNASYIGLMGQNDCSNQLDLLGSEDCTKCSLDSKDGSCDECKELLRCGYGSNVCVDSTNVGTDFETGEDVISGDNCNVCVAPKNNICCVSPNINPYTTSAEKISWDEANHGENGLLATLGNRVSYVCSKSCPNGSVNLKDLEAQNCGNTPCAERTESNCLDCETCTWVDEDLENFVTGHCSAQCPLPPSNTNKGWGVQQKETGEHPEFPTPAPTLAPTIPPTSGPGITDSPTNPTDPPSSGSSVVVPVVAGVVGALALGGGLFWYFSNKKTKKAVLKATAVPMGIPVGKIK